MSYKLIENVPIGTQFLGNDPEDVVFIKCREAATEFLPSDSEEDHSLFWAVCIQTGVLEYFPAGTIVRTIQPQQIWEQRNDPQA